MVHYKGVSTGGKAKKNVFMPKYFSVYFNLDLIIFYL